MTKQLLHHHGTRIYQGMSPEGIIRQAERDVSQRIDNIKRYDAGLLCRRYGFPAKFVRRAKTPADLIEKTLKRPPEPKNAAQEFLFGDLGKLRAALDMLA